MRMMIELTSPAWWKAASIRAIRTAIAVLIPLITGVTLLDVDWLLAGSTLALTVIVSYLTSLAGLKELTTQTVSHYHAVVVRSVKSFAQTLTGFIGASVILSDVDWKAALAISVTSAVVSALQGLLTALPEQEDVLTEL